MAKTSISPEISHPKKTFHAYTPTNVNYVMPRNVNDTKPVNITKHILPLFELDPPRDYIHHLLHQ